MATPHLVPLHRYLNAATGKKYKTIFATCGERARPAGAWMRQGYRNWYGHRKRSHLWRKVIRPYHASWASSSSGGDCRSVLNIT